MKIYWSPLIFELNVTLTLVWVALDLCTTSTQAFRFTTFQTYKSSSTLSNTWRQFRKKHFFRESLHHVGRQANSPLPDVVSRSEVFFSAAKYTDPADCSDLSKPSRFLFSNKSKTFPETEIQQLQVHHKFVLTRNLTCSDVAKLRPRSAQMHILNASIDPASASSVLIDLASHILRLKVGWGA